MSKPKPASTETTNDTDEAQDSGQTTISIVNTPNDVDIAPFRLQETVAYTLNKSGNRYDVYFSKDIVEAKNYVDLMYGMSLLEENNELHIHLCNDGGDLDTGIQLINAIKTSRATIVVDVEGPCFSMAALLVCCADVINIHSYVVLMFHHFSMNSLAGKAPEMKAHLDSFHILYEEILNQECLPTGLITKKQIKQVLSGEDIYVFPKPNVK